MMYIIFSFSAQEGSRSSSLSHNVSTRIVQAGNTLFDLELDSWQVDNYAGKLEFLIRKCAHMLEYFALAVSVSFPLYVYGLHGILLMLLAGGICAAYACLDEYHQTFVMGRSGSPRDVAVDSIGILLGILLVRIIGWTGRHTLFRPDTEAQSTRRDEELAQARRELEDLRRRQAQMQKELDRREKHAERIPKNRTDTRDRQSLRTDRKSRQKISRRETGYRDTDYRDTDYRSMGHRDVDYRDTGCRSMGYRDADYPNSAYRDPGDYGSDPFYPNAPGYIYDDPDESYGRNDLPRSGSVHPGYGSVTYDESDELSEDMPFSRLLSRKQRDNR